MSRTEARGFTLIELMIAVAIAGILVAVAVPAYQDSVRKARRGQAKADLMEISQQAERFRTVNGTYVGFDIPTGMGVSPRQGTAYYTIAIENRTVNGYTLTATPQGSQVQDSLCGALGLNAAGTKSAASSDISRCW
ncbi:type IV pilin protein [Lysobacter sp. 5GHs7-4]|uniref:type IV pilin protein n=1 Tax=Lysobacter sp. 5GHs7-4 TaxID=2904253 RepID=UPI001E36787D|nr:type IV pilin protein [Lysobacter sp. 5GHs7-4]UHQ22181.1 type IV pilin protein [Lysobacter sp. 5GHs7-4]